MKWKKKTVLRLGLILACIIFLLSPFWFEIPLVKASTQEWKISTGYDDCGRWWKDGVPFGFSKDNNFFWCGDDTSSLWDYSSGMRFINIIIPQGSTINNANLTLMARPTYYETIPITYIEGQDSDDTVTFSDGADYDARPRTSANVAWTPSDWQTDVFYTSTDITSVIQEIINRPGWVSGHSLVLFWRDAPGWGGSHKWLSASAYEYGLPDRASLKITWSPPPPPPPPPPIYPNYMNDKKDGRIILYGGIQFKPNTIHTYIPQFNGRYKNITLDSGTLGLSKGDNAYNIACSTDDNVTVNLNKWFYTNRYNTEFRPNAETESSLTFTVNTRERGEPGEVSGVSTWSYDEATTTVSLTCANYSYVSMWFLGDAEKMFEWITVRTLTWMGIAGIALMFLSPVMIVFFVKKKEYETSMIIALMGFALGFAMIVAWLWA